MKALLLISLCVAVSCAPSNLAADGGVITADGGGVDGGMVTPSEETCGTHGQTCDMTCPAGFKCATGATGPKFCVSAREECGGFTNVPCETTGTTCVHYSGSDFGACLFPSEKDCICLRAPMGISDCH